MRLEDWDIDICDAGADDFVFYEDGYTLFVRTYHDYDRPLQHLTWWVDEFYLIGEDALPLNDNAGMSEELYSAYDLDIKSAIAEKLEEWFK